MATSERICPTVLRQLLAYDEQTGVLTWLHRDEKWFSHAADPKRIAASWNRRLAGKRAFTTVGSHGYFEGAVFGKAVLAHRVAYAIAHGIWPVQVDHINGDRHDNRRANLRDVGHIENMRNVAGKPTANRSGHTGVSYRRDKGTWRARLMVNRQEICLGHFATMEAAIEARRSALATYGFTERHGALPA